MQRNTAVPEPQQMWLHWHPREKILPVRKERNHAGLIIQHVRQEGYQRRLI